MIPGFVFILNSVLASLTGLFDEALIRHQVKYLGLMEHLRVRRAGFAYRRKYDVFLKRFGGKLDKDIFINNCQQIQIIFLFLLDINPCAQQPGLTGEACPLME